MQLPAAAFRNPYLTTLLMGLVPMATGLGLVALGAALGKQPRSVFDIVGGKARTMAVAGGGTLGDFAKVSPILTGLVAVGLAFNAVELVDMLRAPRLLPPA